MANSQDFIPWTWTITPRHTASHQCLSPSSILATYAVVDVVISVLTIALGHRVFVNTITCGCFGRQGSTSWGILWIFQLALQLGANAWIAVLATRADVFITENQPSIGDLVLLYTTRPRMTWMVLAILCSYGDEDSDDAWWSSAAAQTLITEFVLLIVGAYYMGKTANFAQLHGYYLGKFPSSFGQSSDAKLMYAGALVYLVMLWVSLIIIGTGIVWASAGPVDGLSSAIAGGFIIGGASWTWIGSWLFWAGYLKLAGSL